LWQQSATYGFLKAQPQNCHCSYFVLGVTMRSMVMRGDRSAKAKAFGSWTISKAVRAGGKQRMFCADCAHEQIIDPVMFAHHHNLHWETTFYEILQRLKCGRCGSRRVGLTGIL
jgi:hypothetical protein